MLKTSYLNRIETEGENEDDEDYEIRLPPGETSPKSSSEDNQNVEGSQQPPTNTELKSTLPPTNAETETTLNHRMSSALILGFSSFHSVPLVSVSNKY